ncbi:HepT-like ribonuclease domain-containing protein [Aquisalimonas sp.]|uniref:HepT-like ribonuclease domain-containing protein n=1 Tax=Aquisalimonas sp. TaxID=1872621 RepID=UPI0025C1BDEE|nr:HepT-like ribonuclease domain-containing protein [Aquisalimonas sp.]
MDDRRTQQAVILNVIILGEAAAKIVQPYPDFVDAHPEIPWRQMRGMRNRVAHGYFDIDLDIVWNTVQSAFPELRERVQAAKRRHLMLRNSGTYTASVGCEFFRADYIFHERRTSSLGSLR